LPIAAQELIVASAMDKAWISPQRQFKLIFLKASKTEEFFIAKG